VTKQTQSSFADDVWDVEQASTTQNLVVGHEVVPADVQDTSLAGQEAAVFRQTAANFRQRRLLVLNISVFP